MSDSFYADLQPLSDFADVASPSGYVPAPADWLLVITDVEGSTKAIEAGRYKDVNALGVAAIVAVQNALDGLDIPFVFGGDGATLLCPAHLRARLEPALQGLMRRASEGFDLGMRAGIVPLDELYAAGHEVRIARYQASEFASFAMFAGDGVSVGEDWVKDPVRGRQYAVEPGTGEADFRGFECRWQPIPSRRGVVVALLVQATQADRTAAAETYRHVIEGVDRRVVSPPIDPARLNLASDSKSFDTEARLLSGSSSGLKASIAKARAKTLNAVGSALLRSGKHFADFDGARYRDEVVENSDYRKFDDTLRMILDVTEDERKALLSFLEEEHRLGKIVYGTHAAASALMTCAVRSHEGDHVHFLDGNDGGYALAAKQLKAQRKEQNSGN